jgi:beta-N-acetylhexosaminidase
VGDCVAAGVAGYLESGIAPCVKHFPGHGDTTVDSHVGLPIVDKSLPELDVLELVPFARAITAGVPAIMTAHIVFPQIDPTRRPATLSPVFLRDLLRGQLGFAGLIFADALMMQAVAAQYPLTDAVHMTLAAGAMPLMPGWDLDAQYACHRAILAAAADGVFDVEAEAARVAAHKARFVAPLLAELAQPLDPAVADRAFAEEAATVAEVARGSITLLRNGEHLLPLTPARARRPLLVDFDIRSGPELETSWQPGRLLPDALARYLPNLQTLPLNRLPTAEEAATALAQAAEADVLIVVTRNAFRLPDQAAVAGKLLALGRPAVLVAAREPYDLAVLPMAPVYVTTYGDPPASLQALADVLCGAVPPQGRLPVSIPGLYPAGSGLATFNA